MILHVHKVRMRRVNCDRTSCSFVCCFASVHAQVVIAIRQHLNPSSPTYVVLWTVLTKSPTTCVLLLLRSPFRRSSTTFHPFGRPARSSLPYRRDVRRSPSRRRRLAIGLYARAAGVYPAIDRSPRHPAAIIHRRHPPPHSVPCNVFWQSR